MNFFEHVVEQYPPELKKKKYEYWTKLRKANGDYRSQFSHQTVEEEQAGFTQWMRDRWGLEVVVESAGYSPYYSVVDPKKHLLFQLHYA